MEVLCCVVVRPEGVEDLRLPCARVMKMKSLLEAGSRGGYIHTVVLGPRSCEMR